MKYQEIKFKDFFKNELNEGLIKTVPIEEFDSFIQFHNPFNGVVFYEYDTKMGKIYALIRKKLTENDLDIINRDLNNFGYFPAAISSITNGKKEGYSKYIKTKFIDFNNRFNFEGGNETCIVYCSKFDIIKQNTEINELYHITSDVYMEKIKKKGLVPSSKGIISNYPYRVYFSTTQDGIKKLYPRLTIYKKGNPVILSIDPSNSFVKNLTFYIDPDFQSSGVYTYGNIPPNAITFIDLKK